MKNFKLNENIGTGFKTPDGYFENLESRISEKLRPESKVISIAPRKWYMTAAAVIVLMLSIPAINLFTKTSSAPESDAIENYLSLNHESTTWNLVDELSAEDIEQIKIDFAMTDAEIERELSPENIEILIN